jgi:hypothetical protein
MYDDATVVVTIRRGDDLVEQEWDWRPPRGLPADLLLVARLREQVMKAGFRDEWNAARAHRAGLPTPPVVEPN